MENVVGPAYVVGIVISILVAVSVIAWVYDKTRPRIEHEKLGKIYRSGGYWNGLRAYKGSAVRFSLPGEKSGPGDDAVEKFEELWSRLDETLEGVREEAKEEFQSLMECLTEEERLSLQAEVEKDLGGVEANFDEHWLLVQISLEDLQQDESSDIPRWFWTLEFEVSWDPSTPVWLILTSLESRSTTIWLVPSMYLISHLSRRRFSSETNPRLVRPW